MDERNYYERHNRRTMGAAGRRSRNGPTGSDIDGQYARGYQHGFQQAGQDGGRQGGGQRLPPRPGDYRNSRLGAQPLYQGFEDEYYGGSPDHFRIAAGDRRRGPSSYGPPGMRQQNFATGMDDGFGGIHAQQFDEYRQDMMGGGPSSRRRQGPQQYGFGRGPRPPNRGPYRNPNEPIMGGNRSGYDRPINHE